MICLYNEKIIRTETNMKYIGNKTIIVPLDVSNDYRYDQLLAMIYSRTNIDKENFKLVLIISLSLESILGKAEIGSNLIQYEMIIVRTEC